MARSEIIQITCDICGTTLQDSAGKADITFGVDGRQFTIDLCEIHSAEFDTRVAPFTASARKATGRSARTSAPARAATASSGRSGRSGMKGVREWARANGFPALSDRGRVPSAVTEAWRAAQGGSPSSSTGRNRRSVTKASGRKRAGRTGVAATPGDA